MKMTPNQTKEFIKFHIDEYGIKKEYEDVFEGFVYNRLSGDEQLELAKKYFPIGLKIYTNMNSKPVECEVLGYKMNMDNVCNLLTNLNEVEDGYSWKHHGNTSSHPGWYYPTKPVRIFVLDQLLNPKEYKEVEKEVEVREDSHLEVLPPKKSLVYRVLNKIKNGLRI